MLRISSQYESRLALSQTRRLERFSASQCVDIHCHCLPGLDDGPKTQQQCIALCQALVSDGITTVVATPHQMGLYEGSNDAKIVREAAARLSETLTSEGIPLAVVPGADVRVDDQLLKLLDDGHILTLADARRYILLELPHETLIDLTSLIGELRKRGICAIVSHPERHAEICRCPEALLPWLEEGALLQVTAASLVGGFGPVAEKMVWQLIGANLVSLVASDAHDSDCRPPMMTFAIDAIIKRLGHAVARRLCIENPLAVLVGQPVVAPQHASSGAARFGGRR
jgi:protein-tyrosine phosphatase